jgi:hypothetical protein
MIDRQTGLRLPLVHHLVQHGVLHLGPRVPGHVPPAQGDLERVPVPEIDAELPQAAPHPPRKANGYIAQDAAEVRRVEPVMKLAQTMEHQKVSRPGVLAPDGAGCGYVLLHRKVEKFPLS